MESTGIRFFSDFDLHRLKKDVNLWMETHTVISVEFRQATNNEWIVMVHHEGRDKWNG